MKKIICLITLLILTNCSYQYTKYGTYSNIKSEYLAKKNRHIDMHYEVSSSCTLATTVSYCSKSPMLQKIELMFREYNLTPTIAKEYDSEKPILRVYEKKVGQFTSILTQFASIFTLGIIPARNKVKFEVSYKENDYHINREEYRTEWSGWLTIPFSNEDDEKLDSSYILNNMLRSTINQIIKEDKIKANFKKSDGKSRRLKSWN